MTKKVVITGGGTGGHIFPMLAIAEHLVDHGVAAQEVRFVGSRRGKERALLGENNFSLTLLPGRGLRRSWSLRAIGQNLIAVSGLVVATLTACIVLLRDRPRVVVSVGGYAALSTDVAAVLTRRKLVLVELDAVPSSTHRLVLRFARRLCTSYLTDDSRAVMTGAPLRSVIESVDRRHAKINCLDRGIDTPQRWSIVVMTGSLGATSVNSAVVDLAGEWRDRADVRITHVTGVRDFAAMKMRWVPRPDDQIEYQLVEFGDMASLWSTADVAVCRAGATTIAELTYLGIPSVLVPLPGAPGDHQTKNAYELVRVGGAIVIRDKDLSPSVLAGALDSLLENPSRMREMGQGALSLRRDAAAERIVEVVMEEIQ